MSRRRTHSRSSHRCSGTLWLQQPCELVRICLLRWPNREKRLPQPSWMQAYGRSPVCTRLCLCVVRLLECVKCLPQSSWATTRTPATITFLGTSLTVGVFAPEGAVRSRAASPTLSAEMRARLGFASSSSSLSSLSSLSSSSSSPPTLSSSS